MNRVLLSLVLLAGACTDGGVEDPGEPITPGVPRFPLRPLAVAETAPPPIDGGTLAVLSDGRTAVAGDPDHGTVVVVDLTDGRVVATVALEDGARPGRVVEGPAASFFVAQTRPGAVLRLERDGAERFRAQPCATPQGLAYDAEADRLHVACESGELVTVQGEDGAIVRSVRLDRDLRDVVLSGDGLLVSRFRAAEVLRVDAAGAIAERVVLPGHGAATAALAWRMVGTGDGGAVLVHQRARTEGTVSTSPGGYESCTSPLIESAVTSIDASGVVRTSGRLVNLVLPVDLALHGAQVNVVAAGQRAEIGSNAGAVIELGGLVEDLEAGAAEEPDDFEDDFGDFEPCMPSAGEPLVLGEGQAVAIAFAPAGRVVQTRAPWRITVSGGSTIELPGEDVTDTGHEMFHLDAGAGLACASCHPGGREDGVVWTFDGLGERRTQDLRGGVLASAPFHWGGDLAGFPELVEEVFTRRMGGPRLPAEYIDALGGWVDAIPAPEPTPAANPTAAERGRALFESRETGCTDCHAGARLQSRGTVDVGTGGEFQVPSLRGVGDRAPYLHDGCAPTLRDRFGACGGGDQHGHTSQLSAEDVDDLVSYLGTL